MPYPNEISARLHTPTQYSKFRRRNDAGGDGVDFIFGIDDEGKAEIQAVRFDAGKFDVSDVKDWLKEHKGFKALSIEAAKK